MDIHGCVDLVLKEVPAGEYSALASNPKQAVAETFNLRVRAADHLGNQHGNGGACDGVSFLSDGVLLYAPTPNSKRENFTILHELGHWLIDQQDEIYSWLADQDEPEKLLETICDRVAQKLLVQAADIARVLGEGPLKAHHVPKLSALSQASRPASAIGLAKQLQGLGAVVIIDSYSREVQSSSVQPDPVRGWPTVIPWPGQTITEGHQLARLQPGESKTVRMVWENPWGNREHYYVDAYADEKRIYAIFSATDLWGAIAFHPHSDRQFDQRPNLTGYCCGRAFEGRSYPCNTCSQPYCPQCKGCRCDREAARNQVCSGGCFMSRPAHLLVDGICAECRD